jgi:hypothetical protein
VPKICDSFFAMGIIISCLSAKKSVTFLCFYGYTAWTSID